MTAMNDIRVKICGLTTPEQVLWASEAGAAYVGLVFFAPSPRSLDLDRAADVAAAAPPGIAKVALLVDPDDALVDSVASLPIDILQLHGHESPARVRAIKARTGLPVMKAIGVRTAADLDMIADYTHTADQVLVDAKPPTGAVLPGGNGLSFDWTLLAGRRWPMPWMLAGGLSAENVAQAVTLTGAKQVDVSSGVESAPGIKSRELIEAFIAAARQT